MRRKSPRPRGRGRRPATAPGLSARATAVLRAVVALHQRTGEPVGSTAALQTSGLEISSATVRMIMAELDDAGFLEQVHTSSGRVPTELGLRVYVDHLLGAPRLPEAMRALVAAALQAAEGPDALVQAASRHLAVACTLTALGRRPRLDAVELRRLELVPIDAGRVLAVAVLSDGGVRQRLVRTERPMPAGELARVQNLFNDRFAGLTLAQARARLRAQLEGEPGPEGEALRLAARALPGEESADEAVIVEGRAHFLGGHGDPERATEILRALEDKRRLLELLDRIDAADGPQVLIGGETAIEGLRGCTVVGAAYGIGDRRLGTVAIVGPSRMNYSQVVPLVGYTAETINGILHASGAAA
jgi:heat-inducible transcriptional repressor